MLNNEKKQICYCAYIKDSEVLSIVEAKVNFCLFPLMSVMEDLPTSSYLE